MSIFDTIKNMTKPYDDDFDDEYEDDSPLKEPEEREPIRERERSASSSSNSRSSFSGSYGESARRPATSVREEKVVNINAATQLKVALVKPERFEAAAEIADHLRDKHTVVLNLEQAHKDVQRRLLDFLSGSAYALDCKIRRVSNNAFIITPYNVDLMGDLIDELENTGLYF